MTTYWFTIILAGVDALTPEMGDVLEQAGIDDALMSSRNGVVSLEFDREGGSLGDAVGSAIRDVERGGYRVARVEIAP